MTPQSESLHVLIAGRQERGSTEQSYARALAEIGMKVTTWDSPAAVSQHARLGRLGAYVNQFWPNETWVAKANARFFALVADTRPDVVMVFGSARILGGTLAQIKASFPDCQLVLFWPDTLINCHSLTIQAIPVFDLVATYSKSSIAALQRLGARRAEWLPFAYDPVLHPPAGAPRNIPSPCPCDVCFVGNHNADREELIIHLASNGIRVAVRGHWKRARDRKALAKCHK